MGHKKHAAMGAHIGSASIVMIFAVLCLTIFATLSFQTASYEWRLAEKSAAAATAYYDADSIAEERYQQIYELLQSDAAEETVLAELTVMQVAVEKQHNQTLLYYTVSMDETQELQVCILRQADGTLRIEQWKAAAVTQWDYEDTMQVWDGETEQEE